MSSTLPDVVDATRTAASADAGPRQGRWCCGPLACGFSGGRPRPRDSAPAGGELAVFCRPVMTAPAVARRDGTVLADVWLPDLVWLGELERYLGDGLIEAVVDAAMRRPAQPRQRRRIMSYPLVIRLMIAMTLSRMARTAKRCPGWPGCSRTSRSSWNGMSRRGKWSRTGGCRSRHT